MAQQGLTWSAGSRTPDQVYITRVFNFGTWEEWQEMHRRFRPSEIEEALRHPLAGQWTRRGKQFAETLYGIPLPDQVVMTYDV